MSEAKIYLLSSVWANVLAHYFYTASSVEQLSASFANCLFINAIAQHPFETITPQSVRSTDGGIYVRRVVNGREFYSRPEYLYFTAPARLCKGKQSCGEKSLSFVFPLYIGNAAKQAYKHIHQNEYYNIHGSNAPAAPFQFRTTRSPNSACFPFLSGSSTKDTVPRTTENRNESLLEPEPGSTSKTFKKTTTLSTTAKTSPSTTTETTTDDLTTTSYTETVNTKDTTSTAPIKITSSMSEKRCPPFKKSCKRIANKSKQRQRYDWSIEQRKSSETYFYFV